MPLNSVLIPCLHNDIDNFATMMDLWSQETLFPSTDPDTLGRVHLIVVINRADETVLEAFRAVYDAHPRLHEVFASFTVESADLSPDEDLYIRDADYEDAPLGNKSGPNFLFLRSMEIAHRFGGFCFQNELDCFPLRPGWLDDLVTLVAEREFAWVIGAYYTGEIPLGIDIQYHLNGNAVYHAGSDDFMAFLNDVWFPRLMERVQADHNLAYDCWWVQEKRDASNLIKNYAWQIVSAFDQRMCPCQFMANTVFETLIGMDLELALDIEARSKQKLLFLHGRPCITYFNRPEVREGDAISAILELTRAEREARAEEDPDDLDDADIDEVDMIRAMTLRDELAEDEPEEEASGPYRHLQPLQVQVPETITPVDLPRSSLFGQWHAPEENIIWKRAGEAAILLSVADGHTSLRLRIVGSVPGDAAEFPLEIDILGLETEIKGEMSGGVFDCRIENPTPIGDITVMFSRSAHITVEGDERDLSFALFKLELLE